MTETLIAFVHDHGLLAVLVLMAAESCGLPIPSELVMPAAGALAGAGYLSLPLAILAGAVGNLIGSLVAYGLAARFGSAVLLGPGARFGISQRHLTLAERWFRRHGLAAVFLGRLVPVLRTYISFPAGLAAVPLVRFCVLTFLGALPWSAALALAGYALGAGYRRITSPLEAASVLCALALAVVVAVWFIHGRRTEPAGDVAA